jgi:hypothetical protein
MISNANILYVMFLSNVLIFLVIRWHQFSGGGFSVFFVFSDKVALYLFYIIHSVVDVAELSSVFCPL